jgi:FixJ family two-component response regulator
LTVSKAGDLLEVARAHQFCIAKRKRTWEVVERWGNSEATVPAEQKHAEALDAANRILTLSPREWQVLDGIMNGDYNKVIAHRLNISVRTVEVIRARMLDRLGVRTTAEAVRLATLASIVPERLSQRSGPDDPK